MGLKNTENILEGQSNITEFPSMEDGYKLLVQFLWDRLGDKR